MLLHAGTELHCSREGSGTHRTDRAVVNSSVGQGSVADAEALAQDVQIGGGCPITGNIQPEQGSGQPDRVEGVPVRCRGLDQVTFKSSFQTQTLAGFNALHVCRTWYLCQPDLASTAQRRQTSIPAASAGLVHDLYSACKSCLLTGQDTMGIGHHRVRIVSPQGSLWAWFTDTLTHRHGRAGRAHSNPKPTCECKAEGQIPKA